MELSTGANIQQGAQGEADMAELTVHCRYLSGSMVAHTFSADAQVRPQDAASCVNNRHGRALDSQAVTCLICARAMQLGWLCPP